MSETSARASTSLINQVGLAPQPQNGGISEDAWIEVIHKMDSVYADLVHYQVELEEKNAALESAKQFIESILSAMTDVLIVCDTHGLIQQVNLALEKLSGKSADEYIGRKLDEIVQGNAVLPKFSSHLGNDALNDCEVTLQNAEGGTIELAMNCSARYDHDGALLGRVLIGRPIGELRRAYQDLNAAHKELQQTQQQLVQSEKMASLGRLVAGVAHELNNPISFVYGNMHALKRYGARITRYLEALAARKSPSQLQDLHEELRIDRVIADMEPLIEGTLEGAERVSIIVQDLRRYSGGQKEEPSPFNLTGLVRQAVQWVSKAVRSKAWIDYRMPESVMIFGCKGKIHQILVNLIQNALDAMANLAEPELIFECDQLNARIALRIIDVGPGIPEQDLAHIFDPFFTSKPVGQGTGLGLYISYGQAQELGAELRARNRPQGGAEFTLVLPNPHTQGTQ